MNIQHEGNNSNNGADIAASEMLNPNAILESITDCFFALDLEWRFVYMNAQAEKHFGCSRAEVLGKTIFEAFPATSGSILEAKYREALDKQRPMRFETRSLIKDGWVGLDVFPSTEGLFVYFRDITERRAVENKLLESESQLRLVTDSTPALISYIGSDYRYRFINKSYTEWFGKTNAEVVGRTMSELLGAEAFGKLRPIVDAALAGKAETFEMEIPYRAGGTRFVRATYTPDTRNGRIEGIFVLVVDVTEQHLAELALRESEERHTTFIAHSSEGIWRFELDVPIPVHLPTDAQIELAYEHGYLAECNDAMAKQYGYEKAEDIAGARLKDMFISDDPENDSLLRDFIDSGYRITDAESHEKGADGRDRYFSNSFIGFVEDGALVRAWGMQRDVTERRRAEDVTARYRVLSMQARDIILFLHPDTGRIVEANEAAVTAYGYDYQTLLGMNIRDLRAPETLPMLEAQFKAANEGGTRFETIHRTIDGTRFPVEVSATGSDIGKERLILSIIRNISDRRESEDALMQSQLMLSMAMQSSRMGVWERDIATGMIWWSDELEEIFGLEKGEFAGTLEHYLDLIFEDDRDSVTAAVARAIKEKSDYSIDFRFYHSDGSIRWMEGRGQAVYSQKGEPVRLYGVGIDITERKNAEKALRESEERLRLAVDISQTGTFDIDLLTDAVQADDIGREIYGWPKDTLLTFSRVQTHFHRDDKDRVMASVSAAFAPDGPGEFEVEQRIIRTDGETRWIRVRGRAFFDGEGKSSRAVRCLGTYLDITERKAAEDSLRESDERFRLSLSSGAVTVYEQDRDLRYKWVFPEGPYPSDVIGKTDEELSPGIDADIRNEIKQRVLKTGKSIRREVAAVVKGERHWYDLLVEPRRDAAGNIIGIGGTALDITERKRLQESYLQSEAHFRALMEQAPFSIQLFNPDGKTVRVNRAWENLWGTTLEQLGDYNILEDPQLKAKGVDAYIRRAFGGEAVEVPAIQYNPNETIPGLSNLDDPRLWVSAVAYPLKGPDGGIREVALIHQDISNRVIAEEKLTHQKRLLEALTESVLDGILIVSPDGKMLHFNQQFLDIWNFPPEIVEAKSDEAALNYAANQTADPEAFLARVSDIYGHPDAQFREEMPMKDGRVYERFGAPILEGEIRLGWVWTFRDISERKRAETDIKALSDYNRNVLESISDPFFTLDRDWQFTYMSRGGEEMVFRQPGELLGKSIWDEFPGLIGSPFEKIYRAAMDEGINGSITEYFPDHERWYEVTIYSAVDGVTVYFRDLTERKQAESTLQESEQRMRVAMNAARMYSWEIDVETRKTVISNNSAEVLGFKRTAGPTDLQLQISTIIHPDDRSTAVDALEKAFVTGEYHQELRFISPETGQIVWAEGQGTARRDENGKRVKLFGVTQNITARKHAEEALRESEEKYRNLFNTIDEGFASVEMIFDENEKPVDYRFLELNPMFENLTGLRNAAGKTARELIPGLEDFWFETYGKVALTGEAIRFENHSESMNRWFNVFASRIADDTNRKIAIVFTNITERKLAEEKIKKLAERNREILESITEGFFTLNRDWRFTYVNPQAEMILDRKRGDLTGNVIWDVYPGTIGTEFEKAYRRTAEEGETSTFTSYYPDHDVWYEVNAYPAANGITVYFRNVTVRVTAENALRESEETLRTMADSIPQLAWMAEPDGSIFWYNQRWYEYTGTEPEQMEGWGWQSVHDPETLPKVIAGWTKSIETGESFEMEFPLRGADGSFRWFLTRVNPLRDSDGKIVRWFGTNTDIDEQKRIQAELELQSLIVKTGHEPILVFELDGVIVNWNTGCELLYGYKSDEAVGHSSHKLLRTVFPAGFEQFRTELESDRFWHGDLRHTTKEGREITVETRLQLVEIDGRLLVLEATRDISDRRAAEARLALVAQLGELIRRIENPGDLLFAVSELAGKHFDARRCLFNEIDLDSDREIVHKDYVSGVKSVAGEHKISDYSAVTTQEMLDGKTVVNRDSKIDPRTSGDFKKIYAKNGERAYVAVPLLRDGKWVASLWISTDQPREWHDKEIGLLETIAERTWLAVEKLRSEAALRDSEERFAKSFNSSAHLMTVTTLDGGVYLTVNDAVLQATGYTREEMIGQTADSLGIFDPSGGRQKLLDAMKNGVLRDLEFNLKSKKWRGAHS